MNTIAQIRRKTECPCLALFDLCSEIYTYSALNQCLPSLPTHVIFKTAFKTDLIQGTGVRGCYHFQSPLPHCKDPRAGQHKIQTYQADLVYSRSTLTLAFLIGTEEMREYLSQAEL